MTEQQWTPYAIEIILHHHCSNVPFERANAPAYAGYVERLRSAGVLDYDSDSVLRTTAKGQALVSAWCATPAPVMRWVDPRFEETQS